jgi:hypothetical protein
MDEADRLLELGTDVHKSEGLFLPYNRLHELPAVSLFDKTLSLKRLKVYHRRPLFNKTVSVP